MACFLENGGLEMILGLFIIGHILIRDKYQKSRDEKTRIVGIK